MVKNDKKIETRRDISLSFVCDQYRDMLTTEERVVYEYSMANYPTHDKHNE